MVKKRIKKSKRQPKHILYKKAKRLGYRIPTNTKYAKLTSDDLEGYIELHLSKNITACQSRKKLTAKEQKICNQKAKELTALIKFIKSKLPKTKTSATFSLKNITFNDNKIRRLLKNLPYDRSLFDYYLDIIFDGEKKSFALSDNFLNKPDKEIKFERDRLTNYGSDVDAIIENYEVTSILIRKVEKKIRVLNKNTGKYKSVKPTAKNGYLPYKLNGEILNLCNNGEKDFLVLKEYWNRYVPTTDCLYQVFKISEDDGKASPGTLDKYAAYRISSGELKDLKRQYFEDLANITNNEIVVHQLRDYSHSDIFTYPKNPSSSYSKQGRIELYSYLNHAFVYESTIFTEWSIKHGYTPEHYKNIIILAKTKEQSRYNKKAIHIYNTINNKYEQTNTRTKSKRLTSLDFIRTLVESKNGIIEKLTQEEINEQLSTYEEVNENHINYSSKLLDSGFNAPETFEPKILREPFDDYDDIIYADFETINIPDNDSDCGETKHLPSVLCTRYKGITREYVLNTKYPDNTPAKQFLNDIYNNVYGKIKSHVILFHNLKFDLHLFYGIKGFTRNAEGTITTPMGIKCSRCNYYDRKLYFKDSYSIITNMKVADMPKAFKLDIECKGACPYQYYTMETIAQNQANIGIAAKFVSQDNLYLFYDSIEDYIVVKDKPKYKEAVKTLNKELSKIVPDNRTSCVTKKQLEYIINKRNDGSLEYYSYNFIDDVLNSYDRYTDKVSKLNFRHMDHLIDYCVKDVVILEKAWKCMKEMCNEQFNIDVCNAISIPQIAFNHMYNSRCLDNISKVSGITRAYLQKFVVGGRCMLSNNEKYYAKDVADLDCNSLYPSAIIKLCEEIGLPYGNGRILTSKEIKNFEKILNSKIYFVSIQITKVGKTRQIPSIHIKGRSFTNKPEPNDLIEVTCIDLQQLIKYHNIEYKVLGGIIFDKVDVVGSKRLSKLILSLYNKRNSLKAEGKNSQLIIKLVLNAIYGKFIQKPIASFEHLIYQYKPGQRNYDKYNEYLERNYDRILSIQGSDHVVSITLSKNTSTHLSYPHIGSLILSMSKAIMNDVMYLAEDNNIKIYYTDTDSMHLLQKDIAKLERVYMKTYNKPLIGKGLGQFSSDFDLISGYRNGIAEESLGIGKKVYLDKVKSIRIPIGEKGYITDDKISSPFDCDIYNHIRMKGIPSKAVISKSNALGTDVLSHYRSYLNSNTKHEYDCLAGNGCSFIFDSINGKIINKQSFTRTLTFDNSESD